MSNRSSKCSPAWFVTFADMMTLLMCFFVLMLSMATQDAKKFKQLSGAMENAFGVQRQVPAIEIPMGTSVVAQSFSPAPPEATFLDEVRQTSLPLESSTLADNKAVVEKILSEALDAAGVAKQEKGMIEKKVATALQAVNDADTNKIIQQQQKLREQLQAISAQAEQFKNEFKSEIADGLVSIEHEGLKIIIRINEKGSFPSGQVTLHTGFESVMRKIAHAVSRAKGQIYIAGHTDNIPITTSAYHSNWELSSIRAVTVAQFVLEQVGMDASRVVIEGYADTQPLVANDSDEHRAKNRRVEIRLSQDDPAHSTQRRQLATPVATTNTPLEDNK